MMKTNRLIQLLAAALLLSACSSNDDPEVPQPEDNPAVNELLTDFVRTVPGIEKYQQTQTDYSKAENWLTAETEGEYDVDVFYIYPSNYTPGEGDPAISDIDNAGMHQGAQAIYQRQATAFETCCNIYAPYYRQVDGSYCLQLTSEDEWSLIRYQASQDLTRALDYYFEHWNQGKPFILAGHSQGSENLLALLQDYFHKDDAHKTLLSRMVVAYAIGFSVTDEYLQRNPDVPFAKSAFDTGCIVSWNTEGPGNKGQHNAVVKPHAHSINPLNWQIDETPATAEQNLGSLTSVEEGIVTPGIADATLNTERGVVVCTTANPAKYGLPAFVAHLFGPESFHGHDYGLYYMNIRKNAKDRINTYLNK
ncbi:MAG: DUF3089 domain-containing protein [Bacteroidaceae bacterium]|nr:DUF3089 domain-containing protein [Bacteroidaceae bacterium]